MSHLFPKKTIPCHINLPFLNEKLISRISFWSRSPKVTEDTAKDNEPKKETKSVTAINYQYNRNPNKDDTEACFFENPALKIETVVEDQKSVVKYESNCSLEKSKPQQNEIQKQQTENYGEEKQSFESGAIAMSEPSCCGKTKRKAGIFRTAVVNWMPGQDCEERERILKVRSRPRSKCGYNFQYKISPYPLCPVPDSIKPESMWPSLDVQTLMLKVGISKHPFNDPCQKQKVIDAAGKDVDCFEKKCPKEEEKPEETVCKTVLGPPPPKKKGPCFPPGGRLPRRRSWAKILIPLLLLTILGLVVICNCDDNACEEDEDDEDGGKNK